jgi:hypothetical protein
MLIIYKKIKLKNIFPSKKKINLKNRNKLIKLSIKNLSKIRKAKENWLYSHRNSKNYKKKSTKLEKNKKSTITKPTHIEATPKIARTAASLKNKSQL